MHRAIHWLALPLACTSTSVESSPEQYSPEREAVAPARVDAQGCEAFPDLFDGELIPGVEPEIVAEAATVLKCNGYLPGYLEHCPRRVDSESGRPLCPESAQTIEYPGQRVMCGACLVSRVEMLAFAVRVLASDDVYARIHGCAAEGRCDGWKLCKEAGEREFDEQHWATSHVGWAIAPERGFIRGDATSGANEQRTCRPYDAVLWIEAATMLARMSDHSELSPRANALELGRDFDALAAALRPGCALAGVEKGGQWWIPATVVINNHGLLCMPSKDDRMRTANICGTERLTDCHLNHAVLATLMARFRGDIPLAECIPIDTRRIDCEP